MKEFFESLVGTAYGQFAKILMDLAFMSISMTLILKQMEYAYRLKRSKNGELKLVSR